MTAKTSFGTKLPHCHPIYIITLSNWMRLVVQASGSLKSGGQKSQSVPGLPPQLKSGGQTISSDSANEDDDYKTPLTSVMGTEEHQRLYQSDDTPASPRLHRSYHTSPRSDERHGLQGRRRLQPVQVRGQLRYHPATDLLRLNRRVTLILHDFTNR